MVSDIPAGNGKTDSLFYSVGRTETRSSTVKGLEEIKKWVKI